MASTEQLAASRCGSRQSLLDSGGGAIALSRRASTAERAGVGGGGGDPQGNSKVVLC